MGKDQEGILGGLLPIRVNRANHRLLHAGLVGRPVIILTVPFSESYSAGKLEMLCMKSRVQVGVYIMAQLPLFITLITPHRRLQCWRSGEWGSHCPTGAYRSSSFINPKKEFRDKTCDRPGTVLKPRPERAETCWSRWKPLTSFWISYSHDCTKDGGFQQEVIVMRP